jgi:LytS/YehU family sensor histidine kinase
MLIFYINYCYLIDKFLFTHKIKEFIFINLLLIIGLAVLMHFSYDLVSDIFSSGRPPRRKKRPPRVLPFILRDMMSLITVVGLSVAIRMSGRWMQDENKRKELEKAKTEAELQNLKNQINPHFLLNTLNNIYALIDFNPSQAQQAVQDLSKLLRHILYDNNQTFVPLVQEVDFMRNYVDLMRIRLSDNVELSTDFEILPNTSTRIAPLIFISLIENAFKHGISGDKPSFIRIKLKELDGGKVDFVCENSYFPKTESDKSGKGIGLEQVQKRLEMLYPNHYVWNTKVSDDTYITHLTINTVATSYDTQLLDN